MPELPEVETVCRGLRTKILKRTIASVAYHRANIRFPLPKDMPKKVTGKKIVDVTRLSKYVLVNLDDGASILIHLGMSGRLLFTKKKDFELQKHDHVVFTFDRDPMLIFNDARRFGVIDYIPANSDVHKLLGNVGLDPFDDTLTVQWLSERMTKRKTPMKAFLMDQKHIAGLGNIYVCEALFRSKICPMREAGKVTPEEIKKLLPAIRKVLTEAIDAGGSSLRDYVQTDGELGYFQSSFKVYGREGEKCPSCKKEIARITQSGRSTFFCPNCQK